MPEQNRLPLQGEVSPEKYQLPHRTSKREAQINEILEYMRKTDKALADNKYHSRWYSIRHIHEALHITQSQATYRLNLAWRDGKVERRESKHQGYWWYYMYRLVLQDAPDSDVQGDV